MEPVPQHHHQHPQHDALQQPHLAAGEESGGFLGHTCSGLAFLLLGCWLTYNTSLLWWRPREGTTATSKTQERATFTSRVSHQQVTALATWAPKRGGSRVNLL